MPTEVLPRDQIPSRADETRDEDRNQIRPYALCELEAAADAEPGLAETGECLVRIEFGTRQMTVAEVQRLQPQSLLALYEPHEDDARVTVKGKVLATGKVVIVDGKIAVQVTSLGCHHGAGRAGGQT